MKKSSLVSIIIVHHNNQNFLEKCFDSLYKQSYKNFEIILVDNASTDKSVPFVKKNYPKVKIVQNKENLGFAEGNNIGYKHSKGEYILLLNNDTYVNPDYLQNFVYEFRKNKRIGIAQSKIILTNGRGLDTCGAYWTDSSFLYYVGNYKNPDSELYNKNFQIFAPKGASLMIRREVIEKVGLFDSDFWSYYEETDFCHRSWIAGYESWYLPKPVCYHEMGGTSLTFKNDFIQFHNYKNKLCAFLKNFEIKTLLFVLPIFFLSNVVIGLLWLVTGKYKHTIALFRAIGWNLTNLPTTLKKRKAIQTLREASDTSIFNKVKRNPRAIYYKYLFLDDLKHYIDQFESE